jgi:hypothetical protein
LNVFAVFSALLVSDRNSNGSVEVIGHREIYHNTCSLRFWKPAMWAGLLPQFILA